MRRKGAQQAPQRPPEALLELVRALAKQHAAEDHARELAQLSQTRAAAETA